MPASSSFKLNKQAQGNVVNYLQHVFKRFDITTARQRYEKVDKAMQLESENRRKKVKDYFDDIEQPILDGPTSAMANFLIDTFVTSPSIFEVVTDKFDKNKIARQMNLVNKENNSASGWTRELILFFRDLPKYNFGGMEVTWRAQETTEVVNDIEGDTRTGAAVKMAQREGNELKRLDPYNTFYDSTVDVNRVHKDGEFSGYIERMSMIRLKKYIDDLKIVQGNHLMNEDSVWSKGGTNPTHYCSPSIVPEKDLDNNNNGYLSFFGVTPGMKSDLPKRMDYTYEVTTLYARIIPEMFGIKVPAARSVQIWKFVIVNWDTVLYAEKQTNIHNNLPTILSQIDEQGIKQQVKSKAEKLIPYQNLSTKYYDLRVAGLVRSISDRLLYDKTRIRKEDIDSDNPKAKIAVKPDILNGGISNSVERLEYSDTMGPTFLNEIGFLDTRADKVAGLNQPQQGIMQRGNRTLGEFNEVMANADDDLRTWGKLVETQAMEPIKTIIKANMFQFLPNLDITDSATGERVAINPTEIREAMLDFKMADGLVTRDVILDLPTARAAFELILQSPALQQLYGPVLPQLVERIFSSVGFDLGDLRMQAQEANGGQAPAVTPPPAEGGQQ